MKMKFLTTAVFSLLLGSFMACGDDTASAQSSEDDVVESSSAEKVSSSSAKSKGSSSSTKVSSSSTKNSSSSEKGTSSESKSESGSSVAASSSGTKGSSSSAKGSSSSAATSSSSVESSESTETAVSSSSVVLYDVYVTQGRCKNSPKTQLINYVKNHSDMDLYQAKEFVNGTEFETKPEKMATIEEDQIEPSKEFLESKNFKVYFVLDGKAVYETDESGVVCAEEDCAGVKYQTATQVCIDGVVTDIMSKCCTHGDCSLETDFVEYDARTHFCASYFVNPLCDGRTYTRQSGGSCKDGSYFYEKKHGDNPTVFYFEDTKTHVVYRYVPISGTKWMAENLRDNNDPSIAKYGKYYQWSEAMKSCPSGWRVPSKTDFDNLITSGGGSSIAGNKLKAEDGWNDSKDGVSGNGVDTWKFTALPAGYITITDFKYGEGEEARFWSSTEENDFAYGLILSYENGSAVVRDEPTNLYYSVRCVKN